MTTSSMIDDVVQPMAELHQNGKNRSLQWRRTQLKSMKRLVVENTALFLESLYRDLSKHPVEGELTEINALLHEIHFMLSHLPTFLKPKQVPSPGILCPCFSEIRNEPLRAPAVLIIGPFNYPLLLSLLPAIGSLAAGNPTIIKPSELATHTSNLLEKLVPRYFDKSALAIVKGGIVETNELLNRPWGLIFFTGSTKVGKIISRKAADTLTPVVLELGGKSPTYVSNDCPDMSVTADRIVWGRTANCGQTCVSPDYVLCHTDVLDQFCDEVKKSLKKMYGTDPKQSHMSRIINETSAKRLVSVIEEVERTSSTTTTCSSNNTNTKQCQILVGGSQQCDPASNYVAPTIVLCPGTDTKLMKEEIFGPILPIVPVSSAEEAIQFIQKQQGDMTPLALYVFTKSKHIFEKFNSSCRSAMIVRNDVVVQFSSPFIPIGGLGTAGNGSYHGKYSLETFSHKRPTVYKPAHWMFEFTGVRYAPYGKWRGKFIVNVLDKIPAIPVLHCRRWTIVLAIATAFHFVDPLSPLRVTVLNWVADVLDHLSIRLRQ